MLKIGVLVKQVPDTGSKIEIKDGKVDEAALKFIINPYDEFAIEEAIKTKEKWVQQGQQVEVVGVTLGPQTAAKALRDAFAVGVDRGVLIVDEERKAQDARSVSQALAAICQEEGFHLIFAGKQAVDSDMHAVGVMLAERLNMPHISVVSKLELESVARIKVERDVDGGMKDIYRIGLPCLITANKGLNKMRLASLPGIRAAAKKELKEVALPEVKSGLKPESWALPSERGKLRMIEGQPSDQARELIRLLREEAKVI